MSDFSDAETTKPDHSVEFKKVRFHLKSPVYFDNSIYMVEEGIRPIQLFKCTLSATEPGKPNAPERAGPAPGSPGVFKTMCVFRGEIYVFSDRNIDGGKYEIHFRKTGKPDEGLWLPPETVADGEGTGLYGVYSKWGMRGSPQSLEAIEFNDKIYLFYHRDDYIYFATFDGKTWAEVSALTPTKKPDGKKQRAIFAVTTVVYEELPRTPKGRMLQAIAFTASLEDAKDDIFLGLVDEKNTVVNVPDTIHLGYDERNDQPVSIVSGTLAGEPQVNTLQLFCNAGHSRNGLRRASFNFATQKWGKWSDQGIVNNPPRSVTDPINLFCDAAAVPLRVEAGKNDFTNYIVVVTAGEVQIDEDQSAYTAVLSSYRSDQFVMLDEASLDTSAIMPNQADDPVEQVGAWTLVGVIEGVPPFTRGNSAVKDRTSIIEYGQSSTVEHQFQQSYGISIASLAGLANEAVGSLTGEIRTGFEAVTSLTRSFTKAFKKPMSNSGSNVDGVEGMMVFSKPTIRNRTYRRQSADGSVVLDTLAVSEVTAVDYQDYRYKLSAPPKGMIVRSSSQNLKDWGSNNIIEHDSIELIRDSNSMTARPGEVPSSVFLSHAIRKSQSSRGTAGLTIKGTATVAELFKLENTFEVTLAMENSVTSSFEKTVEGQLSLPADYGGPDDAKGPNRLVVRPLWYLPGDDVDLPKDKKPHWVPDAHYHRNLIPWCLTWVVLVAPR